MEEKASIFELDIRASTREFICQYALENDISLEEALDDIVWEWKKSKTQDDQDLED
ncbi:MAG: hypothetical protein ACRCZS_30075 [Chroococcidiopsis sp.]